MLRVSKVTVLVFGLLAVFASAASASAQEGGGEEARMRVAHLSPDAPSVDVYVDDRLVGELAGMPFKTVSPYLGFPTGARNVKVYASGDTAKPVLEADVELRSGAPTTLGLLGLAKDDSLSLKAYEDDYAPPAPGTGRLRAIHAKPDAGAVRVDLAPGEPESGLGFVIPGFSDATDYFEVPAGPYEPEVKVAGSDEEVTLDVPEVPVVPGKAYTAFAVGQIANHTEEVILTVDNASGATGRPEEFLPATGGAALPILTAGLLLAGLGLGAYRGFR